MPIAVNPAGTAKRKSSELNCDVLICDGFTGNALLKMGESFYGILKERKFVDDFINMFNYEGEGGSPILGVNGNVIIGHGVSTPIAIRNMMSLAVRTVETDVCAKIKDFYK